jgi:hypothetical protein
MSMGIHAVIFDERFAPVGGDLWAWITTQRAAESKGEWWRPERSSDILNSWFREMRGIFPMLADADPDDLHGTDYSFYKHFVYIVFAGPLGEDGVVAAWKLAYKYALRVLVGDRLLPRIAPEGERQTHITALDGREVHAPSTGAASVCIAILDPEFAPASGAKQWIRGQLDVDEGSDDPLSSMGRLKQWSDEFRMRDMSPAHLETRFFQKFILLRLRPKDLDKVAPVAIELAKGFHLGILFF